MLTVPDKAVLAFSFIGYADQEVLVGTSLLVDVSLTEATQKIEELVVVGYGVQRKATVTGSLVSVSNEELLRAPVSGVSNALVGLTSASRPCKPRASSAATKSTCACAASRR